MRVVLKFNGIGSSITPEYFSQRDRSTPRDVIVKPIAHDSRINSTGPVKFRKIKISRKGSPYTSRDTTF